MLWKKGTTQIQNFYHSHHSMCLFVRIIQSPPISFASWSNLPHRWGSRGPVYTGWHHQSWTIGTIHNCPWRSRNIQSNVRNLWRRSGALFFSYGLPKLMVSSKFIHQGLTFIVSSDHSAGTRVWYNSTLKVKEVSHDLKIAKLIRADVNWITSPR